MRSVRRLPIRIPAFLALALVSNLASGVTYDDVKNIIGWSSLRTEVGGYLPAGDGVSIQQVEASSSTDPYTYIYMPDVTQFPGHVFENRSYGTSYYNTAVSGHATTVAMHWYGPSPGGTSLPNGISPGVGTSSGSAVNCYYAIDWCLHIDNGTQGSLIGDVVNNSWIGGFADYTPTFLNKVDKYIVDRNSLVFSAVNNGTGPNSSETAVAPWAVYNGIAVGFYDGSSKSGGFGRPNPSYGSASKPDLVAPAIIARTSYATPVVSGVGCMLLESARDRGFVDATKPETMKALMLAGATKNTAWTRSEIAPLDPIYGAGTVNVLNSYNILATGEQAGGSSSLVPDIGWNRGLISSTQPQYYFFTVDKSTNDISAALTWNDPGASNSSNRTLDNNLNLALYAADGVGGTYQLGTLVQQSVSTLDNVELIWSQSLAPGTYALKVWAADSTRNLNYGLAWMANPGVVFLAGDANRDGTVSFEDFAILQNNYGLTGQSWLQGDFSGDGRVSFEDFAVLQNHYGQLGNYASTNFLAGVADGGFVPDDLAAVPEPATCLFLGLGCLGLGVFGRAKRNRG